MTATARVVDRHLYDDRLTTAERHVMLMHRHITAADGPLNVTADDIATGTGLAVEDVEVAVDGLVAKGWLVRVSDDS